MLSHPADTMRGMGTQAVAQPVGQEASEASTGAPDEGAPTSLDLLGDIGGWEEEGGRYLFNGQPACPRQRDFLLINIETGEVAPSRCDAQSCTYCIRQHVREMPALIAAGRPERSWTLTQAPDGWQACRKQFGDYLRRIRGRGFPVQAAWTTERTKAGVRHIHAATHGVYVPQEVMQAAWGGRYVWVNRIREQGGAEGWGRYLGKMAEGGTWGHYLAKSATEHVADNGGRILHVTRGYFRGETMTQVRATLRGRNDDQEGDSPWQLVRVQELEEFRAEAIRRLARADARAQA